MTWWDYVEKRATGMKQAEIALAAGVTGPTVSRWSSGKQGVDPAAARRLAIALNRPVLEAFVAAGFLSESEAGVVPDQRPADLGDFELIDLAKELHSRLAAEQPTTKQRHLRAARTTKQPRGNPAVTQADEDAEASQDDGGEDPA